MMLEWLALAGSDSTTAFSAEWWGGAVTGFAAALPGLLVLWRKIHKDFHDMRAADREAREELQRQLTGITETLGRLDQRTQVFEERQDRFDGDVDKAEERIRKLERAAARCAGEKNGDRA